MKEEAASIKKKTVYLPVDIDEGLRRSAQKHRRSFNSELVWAIQLVNKVTSGQILR
ncbi:MAG: Arc family DNA-binding protein [Alphaproteobacteria bacterium]|nr:Arc family DNA-binding protein [Alphaproteobacteria bacterium]